LEVVATVIATEQAKYLSGKTSRLLTFLDYLFPVVTLKRCFNAKFEL